MGSDGTQLRSTPPPSNGSPAGRSSTPFDRKLEEILRRAAAVFGALGYHQASIRDIARSTRVSLAGLYYYFRSKEQLLYLIQCHTFETMLAEARAALAQLDEPEERLRTFIRLHLKFFLERPNEMKVLTHEADSLADERRREVNALKKSYYRLCYDQVEALKQAWKLKSLNTRLAVLSLFGMMNWIYTWHRADVDPDAESLARPMAEIFLGGIASAGMQGAQGAGAPRNGARPNRPASLVAVSVGAVSVLRRELGIRRRSEIRATANRRPSRSRT